MRRPTTPTLAGWGRLSAPGREVASEALVDVARKATLTRGLGRAYGDAALPAPGVEWIAGSRRADRILSFDSSTGRLRAEAGLSLDEIIRIFLPRGFWPPACPGTRFVSLGGAVAADVHGKSHHRDGSFGKHVRGVRLVLADGREVEASREQNPDLFRATLGGMGLTGHILEVELDLQRVPSSWIVQETERIVGLDEFVTALRRAAREWPYTVGWIDCVTGGRSLGRGVLICGRWAEASETPEHSPRERRHVSIPFELPSWLVSSTTVRIFNELYYRAHPRHRRRRIVSASEFFFPLDTILHWNRAYGKRGFFQYQCVLPEAERPGATRRFLEELARQRVASSLCVIKDCGEQGEGLLSFPMPGITIAADIPVRTGTHAVVDRLNELVLAEGGRIYLAKDAFTRAKHFQAMEPRLAEFLRVRRRWDPAGRCRSALSVRLFGEDHPIASDQASI